jgi:catechol 2,3-dioxygenase-like lactoylglutathione lyase family enzyme
MKRIKHHIVAFGAADLAAESRFWAGVLGVRAKTAIGTW